MTLSLLCGLVVLVVTVTTVVPEKKRELAPTAEPILYTATLWCPPCDQGDSPIILWEKVGDGVSRGAKTGELVHSTTVSVLSEQWSEPEQRTYYKVVAGGQTGWVPETFLRQ
jgi:hypothetical protein